MRFGLSRPDSSGIELQKSASPIVLNMPRQFAIASHDGKQLEVSGVDAQAG